ncbi:MAG: hypothetical protein PHR77_20025 [Kiritimatiellae bacterium]|nr:hypothetical protein [Kiritimatiellia bacterium]MDD5522856.1 hypothetical protein [Kiritimatiellia bacterium]
MIIKPKSREETPKTTDNNLMMLWIFLSIVSFVVLVCVFRNSEVRGPSSSPVNITQSNKGTIGVIPPQNVHPAGQQMTEAERAVLAEKNNVIAKDPLKVGEEQAKYLRNELETKTDLSAQERSNLVNTIRLVESGKVLLE